jgi:hypothetical protein
MLFFRSSHPQDRAGDQSRSDGGRAPQAMTGFGLA